MSDLSVITSGVEIKNFCNDFNWSSDADTLGIQLTFDSIKDIPEGAVVSMLWSGKEYFRGIVLKQIQKRWTYSYLVQDYSFYLKNEEILQFNGQRTDEAIISIASKNYMQYEIDNIPTPVKQIYTGELTQTIDDMLDKAEKDQGVEYFKEITSNILRVKKLDDMIITPKIILPKDADIESSIEEMKNKITIISGSDDNLSVVATAEDTSVQDYYGILSKVESIDETDIAKAQNTANNLLSKLNKIFRSTSFDVIGVDGAEEIRANRKIYIQLGNRLNAYCKIKSASHSLSKGYHKISMNLEW